MKLVWDLHLNFSAFRLLQKRTGHTFMFTTALYVCVVYMYLHMLICLYVEIGSATDYDYEYLRIGGWLYTIKYKLHFTDSHCFALVGLVAHRNFSFEVEVFFFYFPQLKKNFFNLFVDSRAESRTEHNRSWSKLKLKKLWGFSNFKNTVYSELRIVDSNRISIIHFYEVVQFTI